MTQTRRGVTGLQTVRESKQDTHFTDKAMKSRDRFVAVEKIFVPLLFKCGNIHVPDVLNTGIYVFRDRYIKKQVIQTRQPESVNDKEIKARTD